MLPPEGDDVDTAEPAAYPPSPDLDSPQLAWLVAAYRGDAAAAPAGSEQEGGGGGNDSQDSIDEAAEAEAEEARLMEQLRRIGGSLWSTLTPPGSAGAGCGTANYTSRAQADFRYSEQAVAAMHLDSQHHRRKNAHSAYAEVSARDAVLRRSAAAVSGAAK